MTSEPMGMDRIVSYWFGESVPPLYTVCMASWAALDYKPVLYSYFDRIEGVPSSVEIRDASEILGREHQRRFEHRSGHAHFADIFRMELMQRGLGVWCDTDYLALKRFPAPKSVLLAKERGDWPANAVFWTPPEHPIPTGVLKAYRSDSLGPWAYAKTRWRALRKMFRGQKMALKDLPHAHWGRHAMVYYVWRLGIKNELLPQDTFFAPETYTNELLRAEPFDRIISEPAIHGIHFFAKKGLNEPPVAGSFYEWAWNKYKPYF
ncbi:MAG: hypothetical protein MRY74_14300 [Neomegalonema sp.]|nr:hypothetical protein [Neomegalonema sp.]